MIRNELSDVITSVLNKPYGHPDIKIERPHLDSHGDFALPLAFGLAKIKKQAPPLLAGQLVEEFKKNKGLIEAYDA